MLTGFQMKISSFLINKKQDTYVRFGDILFGKYVERLCTFS